MDLKNIIDKKSDYADYMLDEITHICKDMLTGRKAGLRVYG